MKSKSTLRSFLTFAGSSLLAVSSSYAVICNWQGDDLLTASWADADNWDTAPADSLTTDIANFNLATYGGNPVYAPNAGTTSINGITIGASNGAMTLTTTNLSIGGSGITIANGAGALNVSGAVTVGAAQSWTNNDNDVATFGVINLNATVTTKLTLAGNFLFTGENTGKSSIDINSGTLEVGSAARLYTDGSGITSIVTVKSGATLRLNAWNYGDLGSMGYIWMHKERLVVNGGIIEYAGNSNVVNTDADRAFTIGTGGATLKTTTAGQTWTLTGSNSTYRTITTSSGNNLTVGGAGNGAFQKILAGAGGITKTDGGTWTLSGANTFTGVTTLTGGTLSVGSIGNGGVTGNLGAASNAATNIVFNGGTLKYTGDNSTSNRAFTINADKTATIETTNNISFAGATGTATNGALTKTGAGTLTLTSANTYTGLTTVSAGTLAYGLSDMLSTGGVTVDGATAVLNLGADRTDSVGTVTVDGGGSITGTGTSALTSTGTFEMKSGSVSAKLNGVGIALNKSTEGTVTLSGINTYSGGTTVSAGTLALSNNGAAGSGAISLTGATSILQIGSGISLGNVNNDITISNAGADVVRTVAATTGTYSLGSDIDLKSSFAGGKPDTTANILNGTNAGAQETLTMSFSASPSVTVANDSARRSDVFTISNSGTFDQFVLQLVVTGSASDTLLGWLNNSNQWEPAGITFKGLVAYDSGLHTTTGDYGFDSATGSAWAILNHGGSYSLIPEPTSALAGLLLGAGLLRRRRK